MLYSAEEVGILGKKMYLSKDEKGVVKNLKKLLKNELNDPSLLELYASVWYLLPKRTIIDEDIQYVIKTISEEKPDYTRTEVKKCINEIIQFKNK